LPTPSAAFWPLAPPAPHRGSGPMSSPDCRPPGWLAVG